MQIPFLGSTHTLRPSITHEFIALPLTALDYPTFSAGEGEILSGIVES